MNHTGKETMYNTLKNIADYTWTVMVINTEFAAIVCMYCMYIDTQEIDNIV